jgi:hypothetical protein
MGYYFLSLFIWILTFGEICMPSKEKPPIKCMVCGEKEAVFIQCERCMVASKQGRHGKFKKLAYKTLGKKCNRCGETDPMCLSIHHHDKNGHPYDLKYVEVLCLNCHMGRVHKQIRDD